MKEIRIGANAVIPIILAIIVITGAVFIGLLYNEVKTNRQIIKDLSEDIKINRDEIIDNLQATQDLSKEVQINRNAILTNQQTIISIHDDVNEWIDAFNKWFEEDFGQP